MVQSYNSTDMATAWKNFCLILSEIRSYILVTISHLLKTHIYILSSSLCHTASMDFPDSLSPFVYLPLLPIGLQDYIRYPYRAVVDKFLLVGQHLHVCVKGSIGEYRLWVWPYFASSVPHVLFVLFWWF